MKRIIAILAVLAMLFALAACGSNGGNSTTTSEKETTVTTEGNTSEEETNEEKTNEDENASNGVDAFEFAGISIVLPEGFTLYGSEEDGTVIAYAPGYPEKTDSVTLTKTAADSIDNFSQEMFEEMYKQVFDGFEAISFEKGKLDGKDAVMFVYKFSVSENEMSQNQKIIFTDDATVSITYTSVSGDFDEAFEQSAQTIKVLPASSGNEETTAPDAE